MLVERGMYSKQCAAGRMTELMSVYTLCNTRVLLLLAVLDTQQLESSRNMLRPFLTVRTITTSILTCCAPLPSEL